MIEHNIIKLDLNNANKIRFGEWGQLERNFVNVTSLLLVSLWCMGSFSHVIEKACRGMEGYRIPLGILSKFRAVPYIFSKCLLAIGLILLMLKGILSFLTNHKTDQKWKLSLFQWWFKLLLEIICRKCAYP